MTIQQNVDKLFKTGLEEFSESPPAFVWDNIEHRLNKKRAAKKRNIMFAVAASIAILLSFGAGYMFTNVQITNEIALNQIEVPPIVEPTEVSNELAKPELLNQQPANTLNTVTEESVLDVPEKSTNKGLESQPITPEEKSDNNSKSNVKKSNSSGTLLPPMFASLADYQMNTAVMESKVEDEIKTVDFMELKVLSASSIDFNRVLNYDTRQLDLAYDNDLVLPEAKDYSVWSVGVSAAPLLSYRNVNSVSNESLSTANVYSNYEQDYANEKPLMSYSVGVNVDYAVSNRWKIQSGIYYSELGQVSENVGLNNQSGYNPYDNSAYSVNTSMGNVDVAGNANQLLTKYPGAENTIKDYIYAASIEDWNLKNEIPVAQTDIVQTFEFYELPIVVNYTIVDRKLAVNMSGGISASVLYSNNAYIENDGNRYNLNAESGDLNTMNYNSIIGLGVEYPIITALKFSLRPTFRYALNSLNTTNSVYPYSLGIYTGLRYSF